MKINFLKIAFLSLSILTLASCSSNDESDPEIIIEPPVLNPSDPLTTQNVQIIWLTQMLPKKP